MKNKYKKIIFSIFFLGITLLFPTSYIFADACPNIPGDQPTVPSGFELNAEGNCVFADDLNDNNSGFNPGSTGTGTVDQSVPPNPNPLTSDNASGETIPDSDGSYTLLAPLSNFTTFNSLETCAFGRYLDIMINIFLGICAVLAMVMIVVGGIEYMTSELVSSKENGKQQITQAIFGLLLALGAWIILNEINPRLLELCLNRDDIPYAEPQYIKTFKISGGLTPQKNSKNIKVRFNEQAYPLAKKAAAKTGVNVAFILAIFSQETASGANTGKCNYLNAHMKPGQLPYLIEVAEKLDMAYEKINMSCRAGASTYGGAIGLTQFLPGTWAQFAGQAQALLGQYPNPWNLEHALLMTALYMKSVGASTNEHQAACKYFAGPGGDCTLPGNIAYADGVMARKANIQAQIAAGIANGTLTP